MLEEMFRKRLVTRGDVAPLQLALLGELPESCALSALDRLRALLRITHVEVPGAMLLSLIKEQQRFI
jgi:hypothetical protein